MIILKPTNKYKNYIYKSYYYNKYKNYIYKIIVLNLYIYIYICIDIISNFKLI